MKKLLREHPWVILLILLFPSAYAYYAIFGFDWLLILYAVVEAGCLYWGGLGDDLREIRTRCRILLKK